jgi:hypothetical protein
MKITVEINYTASTFCTFDLPEGKSWGDVTDWYVKWGTLYAAFNGGEYQDLGNIDISLDNIDFKRPDHSVVYATLEDDNGDQPDFDTILAEQS